jgi:hypothetical protein
VLKSTGRVFLRVDSTRNLLLCGKPTDSVALTTTPLGRPKRRFANLPINWENMGGFSAFIERWNYLKSGSIQVSHYNCYWKHLQNLIDIEILKMNQKHKFKDHDVDKNKYCSTFIQKGIKYFTLFSII